MKSSGVQWNPVESSGVHVDYVGDGKVLDLRHVLLVWYSGTMQLGCEQLLLHNFDYQDRLEGLMQM